MVQSKRRNDLKKVLIVGCGNRALEMFIKPIIESKEFCISAICDINKKRVEYIEKQIPYEIKCFTKLPQKDDLTCYDFCIITTRDSSHADLALQVALAGVNVICEKPVATTIEQCKRLILAQEISKNIKIVFNSRYMPINKEIKDILSTGRLGEIKLINYNWYIDKAHGAEYFRRWHRKKEESGGLLIHKACHHFDLVNWWLEDFPMQVQAINVLSEFGNRNEGGRTCRDCTETAACEYKMSDAKKREYDNLYFRCEMQDKYLRDGCVYSKEINVPDIMNVHVKYSKGCLLNYSLIMFAEETGWDLGIVGKNGEIRVHYSASTPYDMIQILNKGKEELRKIVKNNRKHEGADDEIRSHLFGTMEKSLDIKAGINSVIIGLLSEVSSTIGTSIQVNEYLENWNG